MRIGEVAGRGAVPAKTIRFWEDQQLLPALTRARDQLAALAAGAAERRTRPAAVGTARSSPAEVWSWPWDLTFQRRGRSTVMVRT